MTDENTLSLLDAWHGGDKDALVALVARHAPWLRTHVRRRMSAKMRLFETSEDVVQTVLLNLLRSGPAFRPSDEVQFRALIARAVYNRLCELHDYVTAQARDPAKAEPLPSRTSRISIGTASSEQPARRASESEDRAFVALALQLIEPDDRRLIQLHDFDGMSFVDIGKNVSMTEEGVRSRYRRALARLRRQVDDLRHGTLNDLRSELEGQ